MKYYLLAHNEKNLVKVGDIVKRYITPVGTIGTGNGSYYAHLHISLSEGLTVAQLRAYTNGWTKEKVQQYYSKPDCDFTQMFGKTMDVGKAGYGWLDWNGKGPHPGLDVNGTGGGNSDVGYEFKSPCDGTVIYVSNTTAKDGWGKIIIIEENTMADKEYNVVSDLRHAVEAVTGQNYEKMDSKKLQEEAAKDLEDQTEKWAAQSDAYHELVNENKVLTAENETMVELVRQAGEEKSALSTSNERLQAVIDTLNKEKTILEEVADGLEDKLESCNTTADTDEYRVVNSFDLGIWKLIIKSKK